jgi:hypothetical protein
MRAVVAGLALLALATVAEAAEWGAVTPGVTTLELVRARYGQPTNVTSQKVEGYDSARWVYEGAQAPAGFVRMTLDFGLLTPPSYRPDIVRMMVLEPKPGIFTRETVLAGWGPPQRVKKGDGPVESIFYEDGLIVYFDTDGRRVRSMVFTPPQPHVEDGASPRR